MFRRRFFLLALAMLFAGAWSASAADGPRFILRAPAADLDAIAARHGLTVTSVVRDGTDRIAVVSSVPTESSDEVEAEVDDDDATVGFEPDRSVKVPELANTPALSQSTAVILESLANRTLSRFYGVDSPSTYSGQAAASILRLGSVRQYATGAGFIVAVIDTGVDATHPMLAGNVLPGYDFTRNTAGFASDVADLSQSTAVILEQATGSVLDQNSVVTLNQSTAVILEQSTAVILEGTPLPAAFGHGTMVAGLIHLVAPGATILPLKVFRADGSSNLSDIIRAIYYAVDNGARVINMSFSMANSSEELMRAIDYASSRGVVCIGAAGNQGREMVVYPAGYRNVISVASSTNVDTRSMFSNFGDASVSLVAPGEQLTTTFPGGRYATVSGTSFSTALTSGAAALLFQLSPLESVSQAASDLARGPHINQGLGEARVDLMSTLQKAINRK